MKLKLISCVAALMLACVSCNHKATPPLQMIQKANECVDNARKQLPLNMGDGLKLTQLIYDSQTYTLVYKYQYTIPIEKPTAEKIKEAKQSVVYLLKANPTSDDMEMVKSGISFHFTYYSEDNTFLYDISITADDIK